MLLDASKKKIVWLGHETYFMYLTFINMQTFSRAVEFVPWAFGANVLFPCINTTHVVDCSLCPFTSLFYYSITVEGLVSRL